MRRAASISSARPRYRDQLAVRRARRSRTIPADRGVVGGLSSPSWSGGTIHDRSRTSDDRNDVATTTGGLGIGLHSEIAMTHTCRASACSIHFNGIFFPIAAAPRAPGRQCPIAGESSSAAQRQHVRSLTDAKIFPRRMVQRRSRPIE
jgi:hypothetical protein